MEYLIHLSDGSDAYLAHHGVLGQKWGRRRYQNPDGSYKPGAKGRYNPDGSKSSFRTRRLERAVAASQKDIDSFKNSGYRNEEAERGLRFQKSVAEAKLAQSRAKDAYKETDEYKAKRKEIAKKAAIGAATVAGTALAVYGAKKFNDYVNDQNVQYHMELGRREARKALNRSKLEFTRQLSNPSMKAYGYNIDANGIIGSHVDKAHNDSFINKIKNTREFNNMTRLTTFDDNALMKFDRDKGTYEVVQEQPIAAYDPRRRNIRRFEKTKRIV